MRKKRTEHKKIKTETVIFVHLFLLFFGWSTQYNNILWYNITKNKRVEVQEGLIKKEIKKNKN